MTKQWGITTAGVAALYVGLLIVLPNNMWIQLHSIGAVLGVLSNLYDDGADQLTRIHRANHGIPGYIEDIVTAVFFWEILVVAVVVEITGV